MDSWDRGVSDQQHHTAANPSTQHHTTGSGKKPPSAGETMTSAKVLLDAAITKFHKADGEADHGNQFDKAKVAAAASGVLAAAQHYAKTDEKNYGKYVEKAQNYLNKYGESSPSHSTHPPSSHSSSPSSHSSSSTEGDKYSKYLKKVEDFLSK